MTAEQPRWEFQHTDDGTWAWRRLDTNACSNSHKAFGAALTNALVHGFNPTLHQWVIEDRLSVTRFVPGESPRTRTK